MSKIQRTSILICLTVLVVFGSIGIVIKWPMLEQWFHLLQTKTKPTQASLGADPFSYDPPLPSYVKDLHPTYTIQAELHTNESKITGKMNIQFDNPKTQDLRFYLYDYPWSPMTVKSIRNGDQSLTFERRQSVITLKNLFPNENRTSLSVEFESSVPRRGTRFGIKDDIWTLTTWYPMLGSLNQQAKWYDPPQRIDFGDPFVYHYADYDVRFTSPEGYHWVTSWGRGEVKKQGQGRQEIHYAAKRILNFALVGSPLYQIETLQIDPNLTVQIASTDKGNLKRIKAIAESVFPTYIELYGPLPYSQVAIAETSTGTTYAMEYPNMAIFKRDMYDGNLIDHWLPHEIAHMWWYNSVATLESTYGWIDEGLVEMSVYHYKKKRYGDSAANSLLTEYTSELNRLKQRYPFGKIEKTLNQFATFDEFDWTWYSKGALLYDNLRKQIGDEAYSLFLQRVQRNYHGSVIGPEHLDQALGQTLRGETRYFVPNIQQLNRESFVPLYVEPYVNTVVNGISFYPTFSARLKQKTVYVPLRDVMEKLGYRVVWSSEKGTIQLRAGSSTLVLKERTNQITLNQKVFKLTEPLIEIQGRTMVPLSFFGKVLSYQTEYDKETQTVKITVPQSERE